MLTIVASSFQSFIPAFCIVTNRSRNYNNKVSTKMIVTLKLWQLFMVARESETTEHFMSFALKKLWYLFVNWKTGIKPVDKNQRKPLVRANYEEPTLKTSVLWSSNGDNMTLINTLDTKLCNILHLPPEKMRKIRGTFLGIYNETQ